MALKRVFVSFDYENDRQYKYLLEAWHANPDFDFVFSDVTPSEILSSDIGRIKAGLTTKIILSTHTLVIVGREANKIHSDSRLIGHRNWINFEIYQSKLYGNKFVAVKLEPYFEIPEELVLANLSWAWAFNENAIIGALNQA
jgi:antiphage defense system Thoeris ThsB-like protein